MEAVDNTRKYTTQKPKCFGEVSGLWRCGNAKNHATKKKKGEWGEIGAKYAKTLVLAESDINLERKMVP